MKRSEILKRLISETGLSMRAFADKAGIPNTTLRSMLDRGIGNASVDNVIKVCKALGIKVEQLEELASEQSSQDNIHDPLIPIAAHLKGKDISQEKLKRIEKFIEFTINEEE